MLERTLSGSTWGSESEEVDDAADCVSPASAAIATMPLHVAIDEKLGWKAGADDNDDDVFVRFQQTTLSTEYGLAPSGSRACRSTFTAANTAWPILW
jgi:hypothetical protein